MFDELCLAAVAMGSDHHSSGNPRSRFLAKILADQMKAQVNSCGDASACGDIPVVDVENARIHINSRKVTGQFRSALPVSRGPSSIE